MATKLTEAQRRNAGSAWSRRSIERDHARFETYVGERQMAWMRIKDLSRALNWVRDGHFHSLEIIGVRGSDLQLLDLVDTHGGSRCTRRCQMRTMPWDATKEAESRRAWSYDQIKSFVKEIRRDAGDAWNSDWLTPRLRKALVAERAFCIVRSQDSVTVSVESMCQLLIDMEAALNLRDVES